MAFEFFVVGPEGLHGDFDFRAANDFSIRNLEVSGEIGKSAIVASGDFRAHKTNLRPGTNRVFLSGGIGSRIRLFGFGRRGFLNFVGRVGTAGEKQGGTT